MSLLSHNAHGWCHIQWTNVENKNGLRPQPNSHFQIRRESGQYLDQSFQMFQFHRLTRDASLKVKVKVKKRLINFKLIKVDICPDQLSLQK